MLHAVARGRRHRRTSGTFNAFAALASTYPFEEPADRQPGSSAC